MNMQLALPQEIEVMYIIPTVRRYFAVYMKEQGKSQKEIAVLLCIRESTVSQYIAKKRGVLAKFDDDIQDEIKKSVSYIKTTEDVIKEMQRILKKIRTSKAICEIHKQFSHVPIKCDPHKLGCSNAYS
ncbi:hypothetical protein HZA96_01890 [Candidatus Woesearchaeota archaeon]|nr:hypothetical protein [Candidatus Woesearchaeota archaeon]